MQQTRFLETETVVKALEFTSAKGGFTNLRQKKAAAALLKTMKSAQSVSGRHQQLRGLLKRGATVAEMMKATGSSRRTVFRYLNHFEEAGMTVTLQDGRYKLQ